MARSLTAAITAAKDQASYFPVFVVVLTDGVTEFACWNTAKTMTAVEWPNYGSAGIIRRISDITHEVDWRGGLGIMSEVEIDLIDDGTSTLLSTLANASDCHVVIYFGFFTWSVILGTWAPPAKSDCIVVYKGAVDSWRIGWGEVTLRCADIRERRYKKSVLTLCQVDNEANYCGYQLQRESDSAWDDSAPVFVDENIPDRSRGKCVPVCFNQPHKAKGLLVSNWLGTEDDTPGKLRGPLWLFSDVRLTYGDDNGNADLIGAPYHYDTDRDEYYGLTDIGLLTLNVVLKNNITLGTAVDKDAACLIATLTDNDNNALTAAGALNFLMRVKPKYVDTIDTAVTNDERVMFDPKGNLSGDIYHGVKIGDGAWQPNDGDQLVVLALSDVPNAGAVRAAFYEVNIKVASGTVGSPTEISMRLQGRAYWGVTLDYFKLIDSAQDSFNNWEWDDAADSDWETAEVLKSSLNPFRVGGDLAEMPISEFSGRSITVDIVDSEATVTATVRLFGFNLILAADVPIEDVNLAADLRGSFDNYAMQGTTGSAYPNICYQTIYATMTELLDIASGDLAAESDWEPPADNDFHAASRLDFQLQDDLGGTELLDKMAFESQMFLTLNSDGDERPVYRVRDRGKSTSPVTTAPLRQATIKDGSIRLDQGAIDDLYTAFRVRYDKSSFTGEYLKEYWCNADGGNLGGTVQAEVQAWCDAAETDFAHRRELVYESDLIQDDATALNLLVGIASRHCKRPHVVSLTTWYNAVDLEPGDQPLVDHPLVEYRMKKTSGSGLTIVFSATEDAVLTFGADMGGYNIEKGDWIYVSSLALTIAGLAGWYRLSSKPYDPLSGSSETEATMYARDASARTFTSVTFKILPVMEVRLASIRPATAEIDLELVEIVKDVVTES